MITAISRLRATLQRFGWKGLAWRIAYYGCIHSWIFGLADVQILGLLETETPMGPESLGDYVFFLASPTDLDAVLRCAPPVDRPKLAVLFKDFFTRGFRCVVAHHQNQVVGYQWGFVGGYTVTLDDYRVHNTDVKLPPHAIFTGNAYVHPDHRGRGVIRRLKRFLFASYPPGTGVYTAVSSLNASSLRANGKIGFEKLATLRFIRTPWASRVYVRTNEDPRWTPLGRTSRIIEISGRRVLPVR